MPNLLLYLLKANVALVLFYLVYYLVLRKLTFYHLNRLFLVFGILFSAVYPFIDLSALFSRHQELAQIHTTYAVAIPAWAITTPMPEETPAFDYWLLPVVLFWVGFAFMLARLLLQFASLYKIHRASVPSSYQGVDFRQVSGISEAFSFWKTIYLNPARHRSPELESILRHEQIHVHGWHTLDVLLAELSTVFYWFNPGVWLMKKAMKENLEFIADQHVVAAGVDKKEYQYLLLKVVGATQPQIANQFNFPSLKRRIAMMNKMPTNKTNRLRLLVVLPLVLVLLVAFRNASQEGMASIQDEVLAALQQAEAIQQDQDDLPAVTGNDETLITYFPERFALYKERASQPADYRAFIERNPEVKQVGWTTGHMLDRKVKLFHIEFKKAGSSTYNIETPENIAKVEGRYGKLPAIPPLPDQQDQDDHKAFYTRNPQIAGVSWSGNSIIILLKSGAREIYNLNDKKSVAVAEGKYGKLPVQLPPPPPPVPEQPELPAPPPPVPANEQLPPPPPPVRNGAGTTKFTPPVIKRDVKEQEQLREVTVEGRPLNNSDAKPVTKSVSKEQLKEVTVEGRPGGTGALIKEQDESFIFLPEDTDYYKDKANLPDDYKSFLKRNPQVKQVGWKFSDRKEYNLESIVIYLKSGDVDTYDYNRNERIPAAEAKYGALPKLLPPPPPVRAKPKEEASILFKDDKNVAYVLYSKDITKSGLKAAQEAFAENGFPLNFNEAYEGDKLSVLKVSLTSKVSGMVASASYNVNELKQKDLSLVIKGVKETGKVSVVSQQIKL